MSHFIGLVFSDKTDYEEMLAPYCEQDETYYQFEDRTQEVVDAWNGKNKYLSDEERARYKSIKELAEDWYSYEVRTDEDGEERYGVMLNPQAKWDWYSEGGRWEDYIVREDKDMVDLAPFTEIDWDEMLTDGKIPFCFVNTDGEWKERAEMGWWAITDNEKSEDEWKEEYRAFVQSIKDREDGGDGVMVYAIDFHI